MSNAPSAASPPQDSAEAVSGTKLGVNTEQQRDIGEEEYACWLLKESQGRRITDSERHWLDSHITRCRGRVQDAPGGVVGLKILRVAWALAVLATIALAASRSGWMPL